MARRMETSRRGFVLVMTLMLIAIAAVALASAGRSSMGLAVDAVRARSELQHRWCGISGRHAVLRLAPLILDAAASESDRPPGSVQTHIRLNGFDYSLMLSDEQAKVNLNAMLRDSGREQTITYIRRRCGGQEWADKIILPINRPSAPDGGLGGPDANHRDIISINHVFPGFDPSSLERESDYPLDALTCWGDGRVNLSRAPGDLVHTALKARLSTADIDDLHEVLDTTPGLTLADAFKDIGVSEEDIPDLMKRLTLESSCYSLWLTTRTAKRGWYELSVLELPASDADGYLSTDIQESERAETPAEGIGAEGPAVNDPDVSREPVSRQHPEDTEEEPRGDTVSGPRLYLYQW